MTPRTTGRQASTPRDAAHRSRDYIVPVIHTHVPESVVNLGFVGALAAVVAAGVVEMPVAFLVGIGAAVARHRHR